MAPLRKDKESYTYHGRAPRRVAGEPEGLRLRFLRPRTRLSYHGLDPGNSNTARARRRTKNRSRASRRRASNTSGPVEGIDYQVMILDFSDLNDGVEHHHTNEPDNDDYGQVEDDQIEEEIEGSSIYEGMAIEPLIGQETAFDVAVEPEAAVEPETLEVAETWKIDMNVYRLTPPRLNGWIQNGEGDLMVPEVLYATLFALNMLLRPREEQNMSLAEHRQEVQALASANRQLEAFKRAIQLTTDCDFQIQAGGILGFSVAADFHRAEDGQLYPRILIAMDQWRVDPRISTYAAFYVLKGVMKRYGGLPFPHRLDFVEVSWESCRTVMVCEDYGSAFPRLLQGVVVENAIINELWQWKMDVAPYAVEARAPPLAIETWMW